MFPSTELPRLQCPHTADFVIEREIQRALWAGIIADSVDICTLAFGFALDQVGGFTAKLIGGAAIGTISLATLILRGLNR